MKHLYLLFIISSLAQPVLAQEKIASQVILSLNNNNSVAINTDAVFTLNAATHEFTAVINLFPIVPAKDFQDSIAARDRPLQLKLKGQFPAGDISFRTLRDNDKKYTMTCYCNIYDTVRNCSLDFGLITLQSESVSEVSDVAVYQSRLNFIMMINPQDFGLSLQPFAINYPILIVAKNAIINKVL